MAGAGRRWGLRSLPTQTTLSPWLSGPCLPWKQGGLQAARHQAQDQESLPALRKHDRPHQGLCQHLLTCPAHSLPAPSTFPCPFPWTQPAAPYQPLQQAPSYTAGTAASQALLCLISSVFNSPLHLHYSGPKQAPCSTGGAEEGLFQLTPASGTSPEPATQFLKTKTAKFPSTYGKVSPTTFPT